MAKCYHLRAEERNSLTVAGMRIERLDPRRYPRVWKWVKRGAAAYMVLAVIAPFGWSSITGASCREWSSRDIDRMQFESEDLIIEAAERTTVRVPFLPAGSKGFALVGIGVTLATSEGIEDGRLLSHETVHHMQVKRDGLLKYGGTYIIEWFQGRWNGCGPYDAYEAISYETQARWASNRVGWEMNLDNRSLASAADEARAENTANMNRSSGSTRAAASR